MLRWLSRLFGKSKSSSVKDVLGVHVTVAPDGERWYALFRAWDRGHLDGFGRLVPESVAIEGVDPNDALTRAREFIGSLQLPSEGDLLLLPKQHWPPTEVLPESHGPIRTVMVFPDGRCAVFDPAGNQLTRYQGIWDDVSERLMRDAPDDAEFSVAFAPAAVEVQRAGRPWKVDAHP